jgi:hypothetical protein
LIQICEDVVTPANAECPHTGAFGQRAERDETEGERDVAAVTNPGVNEAPKMYQRIVSSGAENSF